MYRLKIIQIGKTKDAWLSEGIAEYMKRLSALATLEVVELGDESLKHNASSDAVKAKEAITILRKLSKDDYVILLDEKGEHKNSLEFSAFLINLLETRNVVFVIGGVYGVAHEVFARADACLALSKFTFTHRMVRLILVEQLYRALMINANRSYHI